MQGILYQDILQDVYYSICAALQYTAHAETHTDNNVSDAKSKLFWETLEILSGEAAVYNASWGPWG